MRFLAIMSPAAGATFDKIEPLIALEERQAWMLYRAEFVREIYMTDRTGTVVVLIEAGAAAEVRQALSRLPLFEAGLLKLELIELKPFLNWEKLFDRSVILEMNQ